MAAIYPANIQEFLTFIPERPRLDPTASTRTKVTPFTAQNIPPAEDRPIFWSLDPTLIPRLKEFLASVVDNLNVGDVSCQSMEEILLRMSVLSLRAENTVSLYGEYINTAINPIVRTIANAAHLSGNTVVERSLDGNSTYSEKDQYNFTVIRATNEEGLAQFENIQVCSDKDEAFSVLLSEAEQLGQTSRLDMTTMQKGAAAMAAKLALQVISARVEYGFFFAGLIAIATQLIRSTDPTQPGYILLLSPVFKLHNEALPCPDPEKPLIADVQTEPFLAIVVAMVCSKLIPGHSIASPPLELFLPPPLEEKLYEKEANKDVRSETGGQIETVPLLVTTNEMIMEQPSFRTSDVHRISLRTIPPSENNPNSSPLTGTYPLSLPRSLLQLCRRSPHIPSTKPVMVVLTSIIQSSEASTVWRGHAEGHEPPFIVKLISQSYSEMIWREFYMYEIFLKECPLVPKFYGMYQRPIGGWFGFCVEDVGDNLEELYGSDWSDVKRSMPKMQWRIFLQSVKELHSLGVLHGDLEPRNVAQTAGGFKFFDFGRSELHHCQPKECYELQDLLSLR